MGSNTTLSCRTCLDQSAHHNIFSTFGLGSLTKVSCCEMMGAVLSFQINDEDLLPKNICATCLAKLSSAYEFKLLAEKSLKDLRKKFVSIEIKEELKEECDIKREDENTSERTAPGSNCGDIANGDPHVEKLSARDDDGDRISDGSYSEEDNVPLKSRKRGNKVEKGREKAPSVCHKCGKLVRDWRAHYRRHVPSATARRLPCPDCPKVFLCYNARKRHISTFHLGQRYHCQICNKTYKHGDEHIKLRHSNIPRPHSCPHHDCQKSFFTMKTLRLHLTTHTKERSFSCPVCHKTFRNKSNRDIHKRSVHEKERTFICQYCSSGFFSSQGLKKHLWSHTKEQNYKCKECDKRFSSSSNMRLHEKKHSGIKDIHCLVCSKTFYDNGALKNHMISHSSEKNHACKYCGLKFARPYSCKKHEKNVHEKKM